MLYRSGIVKNQRFLSCTRADGTEGSVTIFKPLSSRHGHKPLCFSPKINPVATADLEGLTEPCSRALLMYSFTVLCSTGDRRYIWILVV